MAIANGYCSLADVKAALRVQDAIDDALIEVAIESASREIDNFTGRTFTNGTATRVYSADTSYLVETDDLVSVSAIQTAPLDHNFTQDWASTDWQLEPLNGISGGLAQPATRIRAVGNFLFPATPYAAVKVTGVYGWASVPTDIRLACILQSQRLWKRFDSPLGIAGFGDMGAIRVTRIDSDVQALLMPFVRMAIA